MKTDLELIEKCESAISDMKFDLGFSIPAIQSLDELLTRFKAMRLARKQVDLREVDRIVCAYSEGEYDETIKIEACKNHWRKVIGYSIEDLPAPPRTKKR